MCIRDRTYVNSTKLQIPIMITMLTTQAYWTIRINSSCIRYVYVVLLAATKKIGRVLCLVPGISRTPPIISSKLKYSIDSSQQYLLIALINTAEIQLLQCSARGCGVAEGTSPRKNVKKMIASSHRRRKRQEKICWIISFFIYFFVCATSYYY